MKVRVNGQAVNHAHNSIDVDDAIGQRSTASFTVVDRVGNTRFKKGQQVEIFEDGDYFNDGFESETTGGAPSKWVKELGTATIEVIDGEKAVSLPGNGAYNRIKSIHKYDVKAGDVINATVKVKGHPVEGNMFLHIGVVYDDATYAYFSGMQAINLVANEERILTGSLTVKPGVITAHLWIFNYHDPGQGATNTQGFYVKNIQANKKPIFGGVIDTQPSKYLSLASNGKMHNIHCADYHYLTDKRIVAKQYENMAAGLIVQDLITKYFAAEGITAGNIQNGPTVAEAVFNYINGTRCMEALAEKAGFEWSIDAEKKLNFFNRSTNIAPVTIDETSKIFNVTVEDEAKDYRNKQYIRAGKDITDPQTERFIADGVQKNYNVAYGVAKDPIIKVNGVEKTTGVRGLHDNQDFYFNRGDNTISQDQEQTAWPQGTLVEITYQGLFDIVAISSDTAEIEDRKNVEVGSTGIYENVIDEPYISNRAAAFESAAAKLKRYAKIGKKIDFDTHIKGLRPGQLLTINLPSFGINTQFLIESIRAGELGTNDGRCIYQVTAVDGAATGGWADFFKKMATRGENFVLRENIKEDEVLVLLDQFSKTWTQPENPNIFRETLPGATLMPGANTFPQFEAEDRIEYLSLFDATGEFFRKRITKEDATTPGRIIATTFIAPFEANAKQITHVGWFGGIEATATIGTGVLVDKQPYSRLKSQVEAIQIDKTDLKGW